MVYKIEDKAFIFLYIYTYETNVDLCVEVILNFLNLYGFAVTDFGTSKQNKLGIVV